MELFASEHALESSRERADSVDPERFAAIVDAGRPVLIEGLARDWPATQTWTPARLLELSLRSTRVEVPVRATPRDRLELDIQAVHRGRWPLAEFFGRALLANELDELYMAGTTIAGLSGFADQYQRPALLDRLAPELSGPSLFAGRNTRCLGHFHARTQALLVQVQGRKQVLCFAPRELASLGLEPAHAEGFHRSRINFHALPELHEQLRARFAAAGSLRAWSCWLEPGDALFIPLHWLHVPWGPGWSVSLTWWWQAALRHWTCPSASLRALVGMASHVVRRRRAGSLGEEGRG